MAQVPKLSRHPVTVVAYDPRWAGLFAAEREHLLTKLGEHLLALEHIGSTAIPGQRAKPIIDMMAAIRHLGELNAFLPALRDADYRLFETDMPERHFLRKETEHGQVFHLHIVERSTWDERNERLLRDYLLEHPQEVEAYGALKNDLAKKYPDDSFAYTEAKTALIQGIVDKARDALGLPRVDVWED